MLKKMSVVLGLAATVLAVACGGGGGGQSQDCKDYLSCATKVGQSTQSLTDTYGPSGTCWSTTATSDSCTSACKSALSSLKTAYADAGC
jgi:hypothetical protein